ncbi:MAG: Ig-like domain-containing protein [Herbinix sp.]|nr:Ig-like domain-containing protein [Herbinix sp.]
MNKTIKRIAVLLVIALIAPIFLNFIPSINNLTSNEVSAAEIKAKLVTTKVTIGINSTPEYIYIENFNYNATYKYSSADKKIATVNDYGIINGVAKGKTTVTVSENNDGTIKKLGTISISVTATALSEKALNVGLNNEEYIRMNYVNCNAKYKYKSSNTKIAKVDQYGSVTGVSIGKTTISVTETYKGKTTKVGSITVNVVKAKLATKEQEVPVSDYTYSEVVIDYKNPKATYKYSSTNTNIVKVDKNSYIIGVKEGTTTISVSETYNKKTTKLGTLTVNVVGPSISLESKSIDIGINSSNYLTSIISIKYQNWEANYTCESADSSIVYANSEIDQWGVTSLKIQGVSLGMTQLTVYEEFNGVKRKIGNVNVTVKEFPVTSFEFSPYYFDDEAGVLTRTYYIGDDNYWDSLRYNLSIEPYNATTPITFTSSNENVITVDSNGYVTIVGKGTATITATCGKYTSKIQAIVKNGNSEW